MKKRENPYTIDGNINWYSHYGKTAWSFFKKLKIELPYNPAIPALSMYLEKTLIQKDTWITMLIAALFTTDNGSNLNVHQQMNG